MPRSKKVPPFPVWVALKRVDPRSSLMGYHPSLSAINQRGISGVYAILDKRTREVLYVGESHTGRLYDTITRHFRSWGRKVSFGRPSGSGGTEYDRTRVLVAYTVTRADEAQDRQYEEIQKLRPRDNQIDGSTVIEEIPI